MEVTAIIPAKVGSLRVKNKNWRKFYKDKCLVDINIEALLNAGLEPQQVVLSTNSEEMLSKMQKRHGIKGHIREEKWTLNETNFGDVIRKVCNEVVDYSHDVIWSHVCDPLFKEHKQMLKAWPEIKAFGYDSMCVIHPFKMYMLDSNINPMGWQCGPYHTKSQSLPQFYQYPFGFSILTGKCMKKLGYSIGENPFWYKTKGRHIDIDNEAEFEVAQLLYAREIS